MAVLRDVAALGLRNLQEITADASEADRLRRRRTLVSHRHLLEIVLIHPKQKSASDENRYQSTHDLIVFPTLAACKNVALLRVEEGTGEAFRGGAQTGM